MYNPVGHKRWKAARRKIAKMQNFLCAKCGCVVGRGGATATLEHVVPASAGGGAGRNLVVTCLPCNNAKGDRFDPELAAFAKRLWSSLDG